MPRIRAIIRVGFAVAVIGILGGVTFAQVKTPDPGTSLSGQDSRRAGAPGREGKRGRGDRGGMGRGLRQLNLNETQQQQMRDTFTRFREGIRPQVEELRQIRQKFEQANATQEDQVRAQALRQQIRASREQARAQAQSVLSPEQQEQLKQMREQRKLRRQEMKQRRRAGQGEAAPVIQ